MSMQTQEQAAITVSTGMFLHKIFGNDLGEARPFLVSFPGNPNSVGGSAWHGQAWAKEAGADVGLPATHNNFFSLASFMPAAGGAFNRRLNQFHAVHILVLDDISTKIDPSRIHLEPTYKIETSEQNYQWGYLLCDPLKDAELANAVQNAIIRAQLCDEGMTQPCTRLTRLPNGINGKRDPVFHCRLTSWSPDRRYSVEEFVRGLRLELMPPEKRRRQRLHQEQEHPEDGGLDDGGLSEQVLAALRERGWYKTQLRNDKHDVVCPWVESHTGKADNGAYFFDPNGEHPYGGFKCFHAHCTDRHIRDLLYVLGIKSPFPSLISLDSPILPSLPLDVLPPSLNDMVQAVAAHTETPPELAAGFGLACVATGVQQRIVVEVEPGYCEPLSVWTVTALESGTRKTAVANVMTAPLVEAEREKCAKAQEKITKIESERETIRVRVKALREATAKKGSSEDFENKKQEITKLEASMPEVPTLPRLFVQDITPEKLGQVMAENGERIALISDEGGIFDIFGGRYSNGIPNLDLILQAHAGSQVRVHRGSRPDVVMDRPALTMALSPQPSVLQGLATQSEFRGRGLLARFLYALPLSRLGYRTLTSQPIPPSVRDLYYRTIETLLKIEPAKDESGRFRPHVLTITSEARAEWKKFQRAVEEKMRDGGDYEHIRDWGGKLPGTAARLAGDLHCAEHAETLLENLTISLSTMQRALALAAFYQAHALAAFDAMGADYDLHAARHVWRWIERVQKSTFTARECFQALRGTYKKMEKLNPAFPVLIERGYLIEQEPPQPAGKSGRKKRIFVVNPDALKVPHD